METTTPQLPNIIPRNLSDILTYSGCVELKNAPLFYSVAWDEYKFKCIINSLVYQKKLMMYIVQLQNINYIYLTNMNVFTRIISLTLFHTSTFRGAVFSLIPAGVLSWGIHYVQAIALTGVQTYDNDNGNEMSHSVARARVCVGVKLSHGNQRHGSLVMFSCSCRRPVYKPLQDLWYSLLRNIESLFQEISLIPVRICKT